MRHKCLMPFLVLVVLMILAGFRYNIEASTSSGPWVMKWQRDRWTGYLWTIAYLGGTTERTLADIDLRAGPKPPYPTSEYTPFNRNRAEEKIADWQKLKKEIHRRAVLQEKIATGVFGAMVAATAVWFVVSARKDYIRISQ